MLFVSLAVAARRGAGEAAGNQCLRSSREEQGSLRNLESQRGFLTRQQRFREQVGLRADCAMLRRVARAHRAISQASLAGLMAVGLGRRRAPVPLRAAQGPVAAVGRMAGEQGAHQRRRMACRQRQQANRGDELSPHLILAGPWADFSPMRYLFFVAGCEFFSRADLSLIGKPAWCQAFAWDVSDWNAYWASARSSATAVVARPGASGSVTWVSSAGELSARPARASARAAPRFPRSFSIRAR